MRPTLRAYPLGSWYTLEAGTPWKLRHLKVVPWEVGARVRFLDLSLFTPTTRHALHTHPRRTLAMQLMSSPDLGQHGQGSSDKSSYARGRSTMLIGNRDDPGGKKSWKPAAVITAAIIVVALGLGLGLGLGLSGALEKDGLENDPKSTSDKNTLNGKIELDPDLNTLGQILNETTN
eukprot:scaffold97177_cov66-Phaeocystis_antarctica.AAC.5